MKTIFQLIASIFGLIRAVAFLITGSILLFFLYVEFKTKTVLIQYDNVPCQNQIFTLEKPRIHVVNGESMMNEGYYFITRNSLDDLKDHYYPDSQILKNTYSTDDQFKVIGYYSAHHTGPLSDLGGGPTPSYLVESLKDKELFWISYFEFDIVTCNIATTSDAKHFDALDYDSDHNFTKKIVDIKSMSKKPFE